MSSSHLIVKGYRADGRIEQYHSPLQITIGSTGYIFVLDQDGDEKRMPYQIHECTSMDQFVNLDRYVNTGFNPEVMYFD